ncbi:MAG: exodeoxyribonuclease VII large subunit [Gemmatimonadota bacterium]|nr:exodeoxyribonuclease VII large subunit [Gemmatimonadota bacterium]
MGDEFSLDLFDDVPEAPEDEAVSPEPPVEEPRVWSVSQVNRAVRSLLEQSVDALWVGGEVTNWTRARSGHCYFTLKDDAAQVRCVMWRREAEALPTDPEEGMKVRVFAQITLYEARGDVQLRVDKVEAEGAEGLWRLAFEKLRGRLEAEGLLDPARKRPLPRYPACVGVVTSPTGAAIRDILSVLGRRAPWVRILVRGCRVQGEGAAREIAEALDALAETGTPDVIIVGRGGGSIEDLWAFNEEEVARAVVRCPVPVVSAVGHEVDVTISDLVADLRAPTPSAAAEAVVPDASVVLGQLRELPPRLARALRGTVERRRLALADGLDRLGRGMHRRMDPVRQALDRNVAGTERAVRLLLERRRHTLGALSGRLHAMSPLSTLERGYSVVEDPEGRVLRRVGDFSPGMEVVLRVSDGNVGARVTGPREERR